MFEPTPSRLYPSHGSGTPTGTHFLSDVSLEITASDTAVFRAKLNGPTGSSVWSRAWLANEVDGTLAETASPRMEAGEVVTLTVVLRGSRKPEYGWIRIESAPLATEHVVGIKLPSDHPTR
jgi:hypothetical protein